ncbi:MAG: hypothetical protein HYV97_12370 [Bdellovibrio sp.]|nr:hypothetical protein [Bdellovibrio sp.]
MKQMSLVILSYMLFSSYSYADTVENISTLIEQIKASLPTTRAPQADLLRAEQRLQQVLGLIQGNPNPNPIPPRPDYKQLSCVARDNDNSNPWVIAIKSLDTLSTTKIAGTLFKAKENCERSIQQAKRIQPSHLFCVSKDNDDAAPWILMAYQENRESLRINKFKTIEECYGFLSKTRVMGNVALFCAARDNDSTAPYLQFSYNAATHELHKGTETFQRLEDCY